jgi:hypothetical protein
MERANAPRWREKQIKQFLLGGSNNWILLMIDVM